MGNKENDTKETSKNNEDSKQNDSSKNEQPQAKEDSTPVDLRSLSVTFNKHIDEKKTENK